MITITISAQSVVNPSALLTIAVDESRSYYKFTFITGKEPEQTSVVKYTLFIDYLFDELYYRYNNRKDKDFQARYIAFAEVLFMYVQIQIFDTYLTYERFMVSREIED